MAGRYQVLVVYSNYGVRLSYSGKKADAIAVAEAEARDADSMRHYRRITIHDSQLCKDVKIIPGGYTQ